MFQLPENVQVRQPYLDLLTLQSSLRVTRTPTTAEVSGRCSESETSTWVTCRLSMVALFTTFN